MGENTAIQWTDVTDNIIVAAQGGWWCRKISPGCANCYAAELNQSEYFHGNKLAYAGAPPVLKLREEMIDGWVRQRKARKHFVASMTDVFGEWLPQAWIFRMLDGMAAAPRQTFQVLTKRASEMRQEVDAWLTARNLSVVPANMWLGVSVENQTFADERIPHLLATRATVRFLSIEPLLGPVDLSRWIAPRDVWQAGHQRGCSLSYPEVRSNIFTGGCRCLHWVIVGGESGKNARPCDVAWIDSIVRQCAAADVSLFVKQVGAHVRGSHDGFLVDRYEMPDGSWRQLPVITIPSMEPWVAETEANAIGFTTFNKKGGDPFDWPQSFRIRLFPKAAA
jgi:protein gp37